MLLVPEGKASGRVAAWLGLAELRLGQFAKRDQLAVYPIPFLDQNRYDRLLWACDLNCVRGEDSFIQAQWAARPLIWQPYVQEDGAHWKKLQAFQALYLEGAEPDTARLLAEAWRVWNTGEAAPGVWRGYLEKLPELSAHAGRWGARVNTWPNLADELAKLALNKI
jgi:uncharacterized repeat protein (TIGR03837 family)